MKMDILKQLQQRTDQFEVVHVRNESTQVRFESNRLKTSQVEETKGIAVRVVKQGRLGFAASSDASATDQLVKNAIESAMYGDQVPITFPAAQSAPTVKTFDPMITDLPIPRLVEIGKEIVDYILQIEPEARVDVSLKRGIQQVALHNQTGNEAAYHSSPLSISVLVNKIQGDDVLLISDFTGTTVWQEDYMAGTRRLGEKLKLARRLVAATSGNLPVLFAPDGLLMLGLPLQQGLNGKSVFTGISPMKGKLGEKLFSDKLTVIDDGTIDGKFGSAPYDDEGVPHRRTALIERGVLKNFIYDLKTAAQSGVASTGNGSRTLFAPPNPAPTNFIVGAGDTPLADILAGIDTGLLVEDVLGLGQGNIISGAFSNPLSLAFKIEKGEIVGRVKNASLAGNIYDLLKNIAAISRETEWVYSNLNLPYLLLPEMNVVAKAG
ncbi:MAG: TldD/PmbA family protein [Chloroflexi bacterium]|nr:TldD/PmbA family protein [Chloroflexota bacterium]